MRNKIKENWEEDVADWNKTTSGGNYEIWTLRRWKKMGLKSTLDWIEGAFVFTLWSEKMLKKEGKKSIRY